MKISKIINKAKLRNIKGKIRFYNRTFYDFEANNIYDKIINIINRDTKFTFKYDKTIDEIIYKVSGIVKIRFRHNHPNIYFINLKFVPYNMTEDEKLVKITIYPSDINIGMDNYEFITGKKLHIDDEMIIHIPSSEKAFINTFNRIDKNDYLVNLILSLFNCEYSHGSMKVPSISFVKNYEST